MYIDNSFMAAKYWPNPSLVPFIIILTTILVKSSYGGLMSPGLLLLSSRGTFYAGRDSRDFALLILHTRGHWKHGIKLLRAPSKQFIVTDPLDGDGFWYWSQVTSTVDETIFVLKKCLKNADFCLNVFWYSK
ncbi:hypothetical protein EV421DRAFT_1746545 [Armillaria borealis]|uniref:Uncharacterized protein n=1 Tax=Armillaria borealis TaxID=47425 RepID=A0AA39IC51_9AGAR|nr:hypothetical protein EV421DRAFT_1746545 [Armillaria borealis]